MQLPRTWSLLLAARVIRCDVPPVQVDMSILLPAVVLPPASSTHLEANPLMAPARTTGTFQCWLEVFAQVSTVSATPLAVEWLGSVRHFPVALLTYSPLDRRVQILAVE